MKVLKSWGAGGQVVISLQAEDARDWTSQEPVFIDFDGLPVPFYVETAEKRGNRVIVKFEDVDSLAAADELAGREVRLTEAEESDEESLLGLRVRDKRTRRILGEIVDEADYSGNLVVTVRTTDGREILLPLHEDLVAGVREDVVTLQIPKGLL